MPEVLSETLLGHARRYTKTDRRRRLMLDWWVDETDIMLLCPARSGSEGQAAPFYPIGQCTFQNKTGLCELHDLKLKPTEGCKAHHDKPPAFGHKLHKRMAMTWNGTSGRKLVKEWKSKYMVKSHPQRSSILDLFWTRPSKLSKPG